MLLLVWVDVTRYQQCDTIRAGLPSTFVPNLLLREPGLATVRHDILSLGDCVICSMFLFCLVGEGGYALECLAGKAENIRGI